MNTLKSIGICTKKFANLFNDKYKNQPYGSVGPNHRYYDFLWDSRLIFAPRDSDTCIRATIPTESESLEDLMTEFQLTYFLNKSND